MKPSERLPAQTAFSFHPFVRRPPPRRLKMGDTARADETFDQAIKLLREAFNQRVRSPPPHFAQHPSLCP